MPKTGEEQFKQMLNAEMESSQATMMGVKLDIETLGIPDLLPGDVVAVRGIGKRLASESGNFGVQKVTHTVGGSSYTTKLEVLSNVGELSAKIATGLLPVGPTNTTQPVENKPSNANKSSGTVKTPKRGD
jgi:phage protein D